MIWSYLNAPNYGLSSVPPIYRRSAPKASNLLDLKSFAGDTLQHVNLYLVNEFSANISSNAAEYHNLFS